MAPHKGEEELGLQCSNVFTERNLKKKWITQEHLRVLLLRVSRASRKQRLLP
jgi:hypothetical protein